jgi:CRISPR-associated Cas5-like protein
MRSQATTMGRNRTGIGTSPIDSKDIIKSAAEACPGTPSDGERFAWVRKEYQKDAAPVGTVPIPSTLKGAFKAAVDLVRGRGFTLLIDKLGERLAFERTGVRIDDALLVKLEGAAPWHGGPTRGELARLREEELQHFHLLARMMEELGADPTAETPGADLGGVASSGLIQVVSDPRTTLAQGLSALLVMELADNDGWQTLIDVARAVEKDALVPRLQKAQQEEAIHLGLVRHWLSAEVVSEARR